MQQDTLEKTKTTEPSKDLLVKVQSLESSLIIRFANLMEININEQTNMNEINR